MNDPRTARLALFLVLLLLAGCARSAPPSPTQPVEASTPPASTANPQPAGTQPASGNDAAAALVQQADALLVKGDNQAATELLIRTVGAYADYAPAWDLLTFALTRLEKYPAAANVGLRAVALAPQSATARFNAGVAEAKSGAYARAIVDLEQAVALNPSQPAPIYYLGAAYEGAHNRAQAADTYQKGLAAFPGDQDLKVALAALSGDLNMDGRPEHVSVEPNDLVVQDGATGTELLRYHPYPMQSISTKTGAIGGSFPALVGNMIGSMPGLWILGLMFLGVTVAVPAFLLAVTGRWWSPLIGLILTYFGWRWYTGAGDVVYYSVLSAIPAAIAMLAAALGSRDQATGGMSRSGRNWAWRLFVTGVILVVGGYVYARNL